MVNVLPLLLIKNMEKSTIKKKHLTINKKLQAEVGLFICFRNPVSSE
jgi:hypothetical protein